MKKPEYITNNWIQNESTGTDWEMTKAMESAELYLAQLLESSTLKKKLWT